jgi:WD40 repeat protein
MSATTGADYVTTSGPNGSAVGLVDINTPKYVLASKYPAIDVFGDSYVVEDLDGSLALAKVSDQTSRKIARVNLPLSQLAHASSAAISPDGRYIAYSDRTRGAVWDVATGKQIFLVRGFRSSSWTSGGKLLAEFTQIDKDQPAVIGELVPEPRLARNMSYKLPDKAHLENNYLFEWKQPNRKAGHSPLTRPPTSP